jgi:hypothetical protein
MSAFEASKVFEDIKAHNTLEQHKEILLQVLKNSKREEVIKLLEDDAIREFLTEVDVREVHRSSLCAEHILIYGVQHNINAGLKFLERDDVKKYFSEKEIIKMREDVLAEFDSFREI